MLVLLLSVVMCECDFLDAFHRWLLNSLVLLPRVLLLSSSALSECWRAKLNDSVWCFTFFGDEVGDSVEVSIDSLDLLFICVKDLPSPFELNASEDSFHCGGASQSIVLSNELEIIFEERQIIGAEFGYFPVHGDTEWQEFPL